jgi:hypothetical protein
MLKVMGVQRRKGCKIIIRVVFYGDGRISDNGEGVSKNSEKGEHGDTFFILIFFYQRVENGVPLHIGNRHVRL